MLAAVTRLGNAAIGLCVASALACSSSSPPESNAKGKSKPAKKESAAAADVYSPSRVLAVDIKMPARDWDALRKKGRDISSLATDCRSVPEKIYPFHKAQVTIDGVALANVGVRKKGFLGSLSTLRPSLKLKFNAFAKDQRYRGLKRLTLNNNKQDRSLMRTCLVYKVFRDAGLPAPRCNFARVTVNGTLLGVYSNVEPVKKPFLRRHFGKTKGDLYEGQLADFVPVWQDNFERKRSSSKKKKKKKKKKKSKLADVIAALAQPDANVVAAVSAVIDYDHFLSFWALETLTGHWDGYTNNRNNFYFYRPRKKGKIRFIPWGPDIGFTYKDPFHRLGRPASVSADATLARRLYADRKVRSEYVARMRKLLDKVWNEKALIAEVDRIDKLLGGAPHDGGVDEIKAFIKTRRAKLSPELAKGGGEWTAAPRTNPCWKVGSKVSGTFETKFGNLKAMNPMAEGKASLTLALAGKPIKFTSVGAVSGVSKDLADLPIVRFVGLSGANIYVVQLVFEPELFKSGTTEPFHGFATWGLVIELINMSKFKLRGFVSTGTTTLETASASPGAPIKGTFSGIVYEGPPEAAPAKP